MQNTTTSTGLLRYIQTHQTGGGLKVGKRTQWWNPFGYFTTSRQCAEWSNKLLRKNGYNVWGNAWSLHGVIPVYSGYRSAKKPKNTDKDSLIAYNQQAADNVLKYFRSDTLDKNRPYVVNMTVVDSPNIGKAYREGKSGSHTGILTWEGDRWKVTHNLHGGYVN